MSFLYRWFWSRVQSSKEQDYEQRIASLESDLDATRHELDLCRKDKEVVERELELQSQIIATVPIWIDKLHVAYGIEAGAKP